MTSIGGDIYLYVGDNLDLQCNGTGGPDAIMEFTWFNGSTELDSSVSNGNYSNTFSIHNVRLKDASSYTCKIRSGNSVKESNFTLDVGPNCKEYNLAKCCRFD